MKIYLTKNDVLEILAGIPGQFFLLGLLSVFPVSGGKSIFMEGENDG